VPRSIIQDIGQVLRETLLALNFTQDSLLDATKLIALCVKANELAQQRNLPILEFTLTFVEEKPAILIAFFDADQILQKRAISAELLQWLLKN